MTLSPRDIAGKPPLAVELDGALARSNSVDDAVVQTFLRQPKHLLSLFAALRSGPAAFKEKLLSIGGYQSQSVPLNDELISYLHAEKLAGRQLHLITSAPQPVADAVAARVGIFDSAIGSEPGQNLTGELKASYLRETFSDGFSYAGNDQCEIATWRSAQSAIPVNASSRVTRLLQTLAIPIEHSFECKHASPITWLRLLRIHQWSKNALIFVPLLLTHQYDNIDAILRTTIAVFCMGLVASATYILNDLSDLDADRQHLTKRFRPIASAEISVRESLIMAGILGLLGFGGALQLDRMFAFVLSIYIMLTIAYSLRLKAIALLDVFVLGLLFTLRIVMGIVLLHVSPSPWLLVFSLFFFFSLSMAKRHVEIVRAVKLGHVGRIKGRGYLPSDAPMTLSLGISSSTAAVTLLFLYVANDAYPVGAYNSPHWLWAVSPLVFLWTTRVWLKSHRGLLDDDPIIFALRDPPSIGLGIVVVACFALAIV